MRVRYTGRSHVSKMATILPIRFKLSSKTASEIVAARGSLLQKDTELVVDEEANVEIARPHQTVSKHLQRALHLQQSISLSECVKAGYFDAYVSALETLRFETNGKNGRHVNHQPTRMQVDVTNKSLLW